MSPMVTYCTLRVGNLMKPFELGQMNKNIHKLRDGYLEACFAFKDIQYINGKPN